MKLKDCEGIVGKLIGCYLGVTHYLIQCSLSWLVERWIDKLQIGTTKKSFGGSLLKNGGESNHGLIYAI